MMLPRPSDAEGQSARDVSRRSSTPRRMYPAVDAAGRRFRPGFGAPRRRPSRQRPRRRLPETTSAEKPPIDGLKISSQSWRRGGLGSKALVTFTLRNANDYAVKDIEIACAFARRDGSHLTDRRRVIPDTVSMKSRKTYSGMLVGFVNVNANKAKCSLVTASRT